ncbi:MAG TPA: HAD-IA family hydrolase [Anaerolineae bacterium]|nr:HAD-IA family hydrolase [Anaerolineae bacterium]HXW00824.1 HAD-IA family hydrolase [Anaerolineae bacterium]
MNILPISTIIFDLSEVLIAGLIGIEKVLSSRLQIAPETILPALGGQLLQELCCGQFGEDVYLSRLLEQQQWDISNTEIQTLIRKNFHQQVPGMEQLLLTLAGRYQLVLLSDHAPEWINYIQQVHPFLEIFSHQIFSYQLKQTKREPSTFLKVLAAIRQQPDQCLFIDDSAANISAAGTVGIKGIQFINSTQLVQELTKLNLL